ncbi:energy transducer TonB [Trinickia dinghuensis]|uniref:Energy transducer TonB n=2 Tax=Trinickia dinghuensis TaxID=2291023 RepID=A0A3D8JY39_9BURK|nr:energy transducer TonB [Trinickia dinghuensis]
MQASSSVVAGARPAAPLGMSRSRIVPALLGVALAHAVLIAVFLTSNSAPAPRPVQSTAIVAQLLSPQSDAPPVAVQSAPQPPAKPAHTEPVRPHVSAPKPPAPHPRVPVPAATRSIAPAPAPAVSPAPPSQATASTSAPTTATQTAAAATGASSSKAPAAPETMAIAAPKHVEHADCHIVKPDYPELSRRREETGTATVRFVIGTTGAVETVTLVKSSGFARLDDAAIAALRQSTCQPFVENGSPIRVSYTQAFKFGLDDD